jgi:hypothetical protein
MYGLIDNWQIHYISYILCLQFHWNIIIDVVIQIKNNE